jgi:hypothetical protein
MHDGIAYRPAVLLEEGGPQVKTVFGRVESV